MAVAKDSPVSAQALCRAFSAVAGHTINHELLEQLLARIMSQLSVAAWNLMIQVISPWECWIQRRTNGVGVYLKFKNTPTGLVVEDIIDLDCGESCGER